MVEDQTHSYDHGGDPVELGRLSRQADVAWRLERAQLLRVGLRPTDRVVDVGCGPGHLSCRIATLVPQGSVTGVDADPELLAQARASARAAGLPHVAFCRAWADQMPLPTGSADLAYARFLLQHVERPVSVVQELKRVVAPGGTVVVVDTDDGGILVEPEPPGLRTLLDASQAGQRRRGGNRHIGRALTRTMVEAGLHAVDVTVVPFTTHMVGVDLWMQLCLGFKTRVVGDDDIPPHEVAAILAEVRAALHTPGAFAQSMVYVAVGRVPG